MNREYIKWFSPSLGREMEMLVFGHSGLPMIPFPSSMGRFFEYEDRGMIGVVGSQYEQGHLQAFCVDSVDSESWYNRHVHPRHRVFRHMQYEQYILREVVPYIQSRNGSSRLMTTGCSFGGYHTLNFAMKFPDVFTDAVSMSGAFDIHQFLDGYWDDDCYFNCPPDYLSNMNDEWYLNRYRSGNKYVLATGDHDMCQGANRYISDLMNRKSIPHWLDVWGNGTGHDWPWWHQMAIKYFS